MEFKLIIFDMDDTLITNNTWMDFNVFMGMTPDEDYALYKQFAAQEIDYTTWTGELLKQYQKHPTKTREAIESQLTNYTLAAGAQEAVIAARQHKLHIVLLTGSFDSTARAVATELGIKEIIANTKIIYNHVNEFVTLDSQGDEATAKLAQLYRLCDAHEISPQQCIAIGDGANDMLLLKAVGVGITFTSASTEVQAVATHVIQDLQHLPGLIDTI